MAESWRVDIDLPARPTSVTAARLIIDQVLTAWGRPRLVEDARLVVDEVVANAVLHAGPRPLHLHLHADGDGPLCIAVSDGSHVEPVMRHLDPDAEDGWGMHIIDRLTRRWGITATDHGKTIWLELNQHPGQPPH